MLTYQSATLLSRPFSELLAADLDDDALQFYARAAFDIVVLATGLNRPQQAPAIAQTLLEALVAVPAAKNASWRRLYRKISALVTACDAGTVDAALRADHVRALGRLRQFLSENADLAGSPPREGLERSALGQAIGA